MRSELFGNLWDSARELSELRPVLERWGSHPALARFVAGRPAGQRLLWINAPTGLGREWFALSWLAAYQQGWILDLTEPLEADPTVMSAVEDYLRADPGRAVCIIAAAHTEPAEWQTTLNTVNATVADLLLNREEAAAFYSLLKRQRAGEEAAKPEFTKAWAAIGGWLHGLGSVHSYGRIAAGVRDEMRWLLRNLDSYTGALEKYSVAAFLPYFDDELSAAWIQTARLAPPTVTDLVEVGLLVPTAQGPHMPEVIRKTLQEHYFNNGGQEQEVSARLLRMLLQTRGLRAALDAAASTSWTSVGPFLDEYWVNVLTDDPTLLMREYPHLSSRLVERFGDGNLASRILAVILSEATESWPPSPIAYEQNLTVQRFLQNIRRASRPASARTLSTYLLFVNYLRLARYYTQAAEHARRLRSELIASYDHYPLNPLLRAYINVVIGRSLLEDMDFLGAEQLFQESYEIAEQQHNAFLAAEAAGKIAILKAFSGDFLQVDLWVQRAFDWAEDSVWGRRLILRCAYLARGFSELHQLRLDAVQQTLEQLRSPHRDFLWEFELFLRAVLGVLMEENDGPIREAEQVLAEENHLLSKVALNLLETIPDLARLRTGSPVDLNAKPNPNQVLYYMKNQDMEGVASLLGRLSDPLPFGVHARLATAIGVYLTLGSGVTMEQFGAALTRGGDPQLSPLEVLILTFLPKCRRLAEYLGLPAEQVRTVGLARDQWAKLYELPPELTPRETEVLNLLRLGHTRAEIAKLTYRSENTVKAQLSSLYRKLEVKNRAEALERSRRLGL